MRTPGRTGQKCDEEMMVTGQTAGSANLGQHLADDPRRASCAKMS